MSAPKLDAQLCFALYSASSHMTSLYRPILESLDLTYPQYIALLALWEEDNVSISHLASRLGLSKATMTPLLKRLEQKSLIQRQVLADNERQKNVVLTQKGRELSQQSDSIVEHISCAVDLSEEQINNMISLCKKLIS